MSPKCRNETNGNCKVTYFSSENPLTFRIILKSMRGGIWERQYHLAPSEVEVGQPERFVAGAFILGLDDRVADPKKLHLPRSSHLSQHLSHILLLFVYILVLFPPISDIKMLFALCSHYLWGIRMNTLTLRNRGSGVFWKSGRLPLTTLLGFFHPRFLMS